MRATLLGNGQPTTAPAGFNALLEVFWAFAPAEALTPAMPAAPQVYAETS